MPPSPYVRAVRAKIGNHLLMLQSVTVMLFDNQGRLLLARDAGSELWMTVRGAIDPDEGPADAARCVSVGRKQACSLNLPAYWVFSAVPSSGSIIQTATPYRTS